ncbi:MAG: Wzz/FepE/Etk N-terminal domain-containing protein [Brevefilum sp.]
MTPTTNPDSFKLIDSIHHLLQNWWKITLCAIIFGLFGLVFSFIIPPKYEAEAIFSASLDYSQINFENLVDENERPLQLTQYDLDLALSAVQRILLQVRSQAIRFAQTLDPALDAATFNQNSLIERYHDTWYLRYRHEDPLIAQSIVNYWAELGMEQLVAEQASGKVEPFVLSDLIATASLPDKPIYQNRNTLILAGTLIGLCIGVMLVDFKFNRLSSIPKGD